MTVTTDVANVAAEAAKATPPITVAGLTLLGYSLQDWVMLVTLVYTVLQLAFLLYDRITRKRNDRKR